MAGIRSVTWLLIVTGPKRTQREHILRLCPNMIPLHGDITRAGKSLSDLLTRPTLLWMHAKKKKKKRRGWTRTTPLLGQSFKRVKQNFTLLCNSHNFVWTTPHLLKTCMIHLENRKRKTKWERKEKVWTPWIQPNLVSTLLVIWIMPMWTWWRATACSGPGPISPAMRLRPGPFAKYKH